MLIELSKSVSIFCESSCARSSVFSFAVCSTSVLKYEVARIRGHRPLLGNWAALFSNRGRLAEKALRLRATGQIGLLSGETAAAVTSPVELTVARLVSPLDQAMLSLAPEGVRVATATV